MFITNSNEAGRQVALIIFDCTWDPSPSPSLIREFHALMNGGGGEGIKPTFYPFTLHLLSSFEKTGSRDRGNRHSMGNSEGLSQHSRSLLCPPTSSSPTLPEDLSQEDPSKSQEQGRGWKCVCVGGFLKLSQCDTHLGA